MAGTTQQRLFVLVPDGSTLEWTLSSEGSAFIASADAARNGNPIQSWTHLQLANQTVELKPLASPDRYAVLLQIAFTGTEETEVSLLVRVIRPDGSVHSAPWKATFKDKRPEVHQAMIRVITRK